MKIAFFETQGWEEKFINERLGDNDIRFFDAILSLKNAKEISDYEIISITNSDEINKEILDLLPELKLITTRSTGFDHIDINECNRRKIYICNVPEYGANTIAEFTFGLILSLSRNIHIAYTKTKHENYDENGLKGFDLKDKTIGVIGVGSIGSHVVKIAKGFDMNILGYDHHPKEEFAKEMNLKYCDLDYLLSNSDIVTLHLPYNKTNHYLINLENITKFKKGSILINTSRGGIVETQAIIKGLDEKILSKVGLDVLEEEELLFNEKNLIYDPAKSQEMIKLIKDHILLSKENVIYTPHIAYLTHEALERIINTTIDNIQSYLEYKKAHISK